MKRYGIGNFDGSPAYRAESSTDKELPSRMVHTIRLEKGQ